MAVDKTIGYLADGTACDYTTWGLFFLAFGVDPDLPFTLTQVVNVQVWYSDTSQDTFFDETITIPEIIHNGFYLTFTGQYGNYRDQTCPTAYRYFKDGGSSYSTPYFWYNLGFNTTLSTSTDAVWAFLDKSNLSINSFNECFFEGTSVGGAYMFWQKATFIDCYMHATSGSCVYSYTQVPIYKGCIMISDSGYCMGSARGYILHDCTLVCTGNFALFYSHYGMEISNTIIYCKYLLRLSDYLATQAYNTLITNSCIYQIDYPGKFSDNNTPEEYFGGYFDIWYDSDTNILADPKFINTSGNLESISDLALNKTTSPCWPTNQTPATNENYAPNLIDPQPMGAYTDYSAPDFSSVENTLYTDTTNGASGVWHPALSANYKYEEYFGVSGVSESGIYGPSQPPSGDVRNGIVYNDGASTGIAHIPSSSNVRDTVPVDATVGTLHVPIISENDVRFGVDF